MLEISQLTILAKTGPHKNPEILSQCKHRSLSSTQVCALLSHYSTFNTWNSLNVSLVIIYNLTSVALSNTQAIGYERIRQQGLNMEQ